jgi:peptidoglycan hydrolase CwlO-like protein
MKKVQIVLAVIGVLCIAGLMQAGVSFGDNSNVETDVQEKLGKFLEETVDIRRDLAAKQFEVQDEMLTSNPDQEKITLLTEEITALRMELKEKAKQDGVDSEFPTGTDCGCRGGSAGEFKS